jgi:hypothetical protein
MTGCYPGAGQITRAAHPGGTLLGGLYASADVWVSPVRGKCSPAMQAPLYLVCSQCAYLLSLGRGASRGGSPELCPACGSDLIAHGRQERFPSAYVGKISLKLHATAPLSKG